MPENEITYNDLEEIGRLQFFFHSPSSILTIRDVLNEQILRNYPCEIRTHDLTKFLFFNIPNEIDVMIWKK
ncbi:MAG: hypothetical protein ABSB40_02015 [Nitrososphaeria archaeon]|jgi:hypothetical protein